MAKAAETETTTEVAKVNEAGIALYAELDQFQAFMPGQIELAYNMIQPLSMLQSIHKMGTIKVPAGGSAIWKLPAVDGFRHAESFDAIILKMYQGRKYWAGAFGTTKGTPPDCASADGIEGTRYGQCGSCRFNQFVQTDKGKRKPCQEFIKLVVMLDDTVTPIAITVPVMSQENLTNYVQRIASGGRNKEGKRVPPQLICGVVTRFSLEAANSSGNVEYVKVSFNMVGALTGQQVQEINKYIIEVTPTLDTLMAKSASFSDDAED
jgi:hypothetical protein